MFTHIQVYIIQEQITLKFDFKKKKEFTTDPCKNYSRQAPFKGKPK